MKTTTNVSATMVCWHLLFDEIQWISRYNTKHSSSTKKHTLAVTPMVMSELGRGSFARVFQCQQMHTPGGEQYAIKIVRNLEQYRATENELAILEHITAKDVNDTSCCIHVIDSGEYYGHPIFVFPLLRKSLRSCMHIPRTHQQIIHLIWQMCRAVAFIHSLGIIHTDIKPDNIMLVTDEMKSDSPTNSQRKSSEIKLIDFGAAVVHKEHVTYRHPITTKQYKAPEVILGRAWSFAVDIWSVGCILVELMHRNILFQPQSDAHHLHQILQCVGLPPNHLLGAVWDKVGPFGIGNVNLNCKKLSAYFADGNVRSECALLHDLCTRMLRWNPNERITAQSALRHPVFRR
eukprot:486351_1